MYVVEGAHQVFWAYAKSGVQYTHSDELINQLSQCLQKYSGTRANYYTTRYIAELLHDAFGEYVASGLCKPHEIKGLMTQIIGDPIIEAVYGPDSRPTVIRSIEGILSLFRIAQVQHARGFQRINYGDFELPVFTNE